MALTYEHLSDEFLALQEFFFQVWCAKWGESTLDHQYYAQKLDKLSIPWSLQNRIAGRATDDRNSGYLYFRNVLKQELAKT